MSAIYPTDQFSIHKLCIKDPWNARNTSPAYHPDTYAWPCYYNYGIVHVPTYDAEIKSFTDQITALQTQIATLQAQVQQPSSFSFTSLEQMGITPEVSLIAFGFGFTTVMSFWIVGFVISVVKAATRMI